MLIALGRPLSSATHQRPETERPLKSPGVSWAKELERRRPELVARKIRSQDWSRATLTMATDLPPTTSIATT